MTYKYCPNCKEELNHFEDRDTCKNCGYIHYYDAVPCASAVPVKDGKVLLAIRGRDPFKGEYDLIGGFIIPGETGEEAVVRETKEETGLDVKIVKFLGTYADIYGEKGEDAAHTLNLQYQVEVVGGKMKAQDDVEKLEWIDIKDIPSLKLNGFENTKRTLADFYDQFGRGAEN